jgi:maltose alpha-D-glucosyltransferase/alpha-amylase
MLEDDPLWYKDAIIYELHVRSYHDSIGDGVGDFRGLTQKLDFLQDLGVTAIWLLPFYPSPLKDDGYDIADYTEIHSHYGQLEDFKEFLDAAHERGLRVITELVINHTSDQHPWFQRARRAAPGSRERDFYVWSDTPKKYEEARIIFKDFEHSNWTYDHIAGSYYWHRFYSHQPDLNYDNPAVWESIFPVLDFWLKMGVDGMRLDAVPYLYEREGTNCENLPETHTFLKALRKHVDENFPNRMLLSEANQWPEEAVAYFGDGDETHMAFHFPVMPRLFMAIHMEDRFPILDILAQTPAIPDNCQWCMFLRNHDELTLEMVTDEERDYMYRAYALDPRARINLGIRHRLAPLLKNNRRRIELMNGLLFSLPGTPVIYYGDEIGMGDNIYLGDRNGVRTPMQWSSDRNAGFSRANPQMLFLPVIIDPEYHYEAINVEAQQNNPNSLLWWMKRLIALRKRYRAFGRGTLEFLQPVNRKILAFLRRYQDETILVVANLSRFVQHVELDLGQFQGAIPVEMFGRNAFPRIGKTPMPLTMGPHAFYWFALEPQLKSEETGPSAEVPLPTFKVTGKWEVLFQPFYRKRLEEVVLDYLLRSPWARSRNRQIKALSFQEIIRLTQENSLAFLCVVNVEYDEGPFKNYLLPLTFVSDEELNERGEKISTNVVAHLQGSVAGVLLDALESPSFCRAVLNTMISKKRYKVGEGELITWAHLAAEDANNLDQVAPKWIDREEQSHTSIVFGDQLILKVFRKIEEGTHPEVEVGRYLTEKAAFPHVVPVLGGIEYRERKAEPVTLGVLHRYVPNEGTAWQRSLDELSRFFEAVLALPPEKQQPPDFGLSPVPLTEGEPPPLIQELLGRNLELGRLLGQRTAELHHALARETEDPAFAPEPFTQLYQRGIYQSIRHLHRRVLDRLQQRKEELPAICQAEGTKVLERSSDILQRFHSLLRQKLSGQRIRYHGNYNLGEVLFTGKDFVIIDFEGEIGRTLTDRRLKRSPLRDVACMIRSYHYVALSGLVEEGGPRGKLPGIIRAEDVAILRPWAMNWYLWVASAFLRAYLIHAEGCAFLSPDREEILGLLEIFVLEKALYELGYELDNRLTWACIPLQGILQFFPEKGP